MRTALERGFDPARADCGLQGTATSPSSTATLNYSVGIGMAERGGFEPPVRFWRTHDFQSCQLSRSCTSPRSGKNGGGERI